MRILEELWYGNIEPTEYATVPAKKCVEDFQTLSEGMLFQNSFKLGVRMMAEVMVE